MSGNLENDRTVTTGKMFPIDLAPQKITIVKSVSNTEVKMAHLIPGQPKTSGSGQIITHTGPVGLMRPAAQIISPNVASQPQMIISGSPILQGTQIVSQGSQLIGQSSQIISQSQLIGPSGQILSPGTQIISQGSQLSAQVSNASSGTSSVQVSVASSAGGTQVLNVGGQLVSGTGNLVVNSSVRALPSSVRVLPPMPHHNTRPATVLSNVNVSSASGVLMSKGITSHVPRGLAAGASLAVRPVTPGLNNQPASNQGASWSASGRGVRGALVFGARGGAPARAAAPRATPPAPLPALPALPALSATQTHSTIVALPSNTVLTSSGVISGGVRGGAPRSTTPTPAPVAPRPLPLLQRNYQPKVVGVASVGVRGAVGNSAPAQLYYEVPRPAPRPAAPYQLAPAAPAAPSTAISAPAAPTAATLTASVPVAATVLSSAAVQLSESRALGAGSLPRPSILRKRDVDGSPTKSIPLSSNTYRLEGAPGGWEDVPSGARSGGSTTISASSSPAPDDEPPRHEDLSPRKKPRKQMLTGEVRQCNEFPVEEAPPTPPPAPPVVNPPPKRPLLSSSYVCGWRSTALHFVRPADVRRREPRARDILAIASQRHALPSADGWKLHHLTAQMDDLVSLEADVGDQLANVLRTLETASGRATAALEPHSHTLMELLKGNIQRSKIVCEGVQEAREDIMRVFKHRGFVSDILARQADKRCFRKHRSQS